MNQNKEKPDRDRALSEVEGHTINRIEKDWRSIEDEMWADVDALEELLRMNSLPAGWSVKPLGEVATLQRGFDLPVHERTPGKIPVFAANGLVGTHNVAKVKGPGVVTGRSGTLGEVHYVKNDFWALNTALWVKDFHGNDPKWVARLLKWMRLETHTRGTGVPTLNRNLVHVVPVIVPPIAQQRRIAAILDRADAVRRKRKEAIALTEALLRSAFLEMFGDPIRNLKNWKVMPMHEVIQKIEAGWSANGEDCRRKEDEWGVLKISAVTSGYFQPGENKAVENPSFKKLPIIPQRGDLLFSRANTRELVAATCLVENNCERLFLPDKLWRIKTYPKTANVEYLRFLLADPEYRSLLSAKATGTSGSMLNVSQAKLLEMAAPIPDFSIQERFAEILWQTFKLRKQHELACEESNSAFNSLLQRAFRGEL